jgi:hypothetical protein
MKSLFRTLSLTALISVIARSAVAAPLAAPGPEIGEGIIGAAAAAVVLLAIVIIPRLKGLRRVTEQ